MAFGPADTEDGGQDYTSFGAAKQVAIARFESRYLTALMREADGNVTRAATRAGKERRALGKLLRKHRISPSTFRTPS